MKRAAIDVRVTNARERHRYEAHVAGGLAGVAAYTSGENLVTFTHTEVADGFEGKGVGSALVRAALDDARSQHCEVVAVCPFVKAYIGRHLVEYGDLLHRSGLAPSATEPGGLSAGQDGRRSSAERPPRASRPRRAASG